MNLRDIEERFTDAELCMVKMKKNDAGKAYQVYNLFIYDDEKQKIYHPTNYFNGDNKSFNLHKGANGKKYVQMDKEVLFFTDIMSFEEGDFEFVMNKFRKMMPEKAFQILFKEVIVPALGSGVKISELQKANRRFVTAQKVDKEAEATK